MRLMIALTLLTSAGCAELRSTDAGREAKVSTGVPAGASRPAGDVVSLLRYFEHVRKLPAAELAKEHEAVRQLYANANSDYVRVRYSMLLSIPGTAFIDEARAIEVLDPVFKNADAGLRSLAFLLNAQIQEQRRGQGLQQKLEALKTLEKDLIEREPGAARRR